MNREEVIQAYKSQFDEKLISSVRQSVLQRLAVIESLKDIEQHLVHEVVDTPASYAESYNVGAGTPFGLSHGFGQLSITRPGPFSSGIPNVCFCGASSRPGNGVPLVLIGAKLVADKIANTIQLTAND
jgi:phytoene desaturase (3,4-didehydrolycopene-forming)